MEPTDSTMTTPPSTGFSNRAELHQTVRVLLSEFLDLEDPAMIEPDQNFAALGTDSLQAVDFKFLLETRFGLRLPTTLLLETESLQKLVAVLWAQLTASTAKDPAVQPPRNKVNLANGPFPTSDIQRGLWYITEATSHGAAFHVPLLFTVARDFDLDRFQRAYCTLSEAHPALRVRFRHDPGQNALIQEIMPAKPVEDVSTFSGDRNQGTAWLWSRLRQPFPEDGSQWVRLTVCRESYGNDLRIMAVFHHLIIDGLSAVSLMNQWWSLYQNPPKNSPKPNHGFFDYLLHEQAYLKSEQADNDGAWWRAQLADLQAAPTLPYDTQPRSRNRAGGLGRVSTTLSGNALTALSALASEAKVTKANLFLAAFYVLLKRICRESEFAVTTPIARRPEVQHRDALGCMINLIVTRLHCPDNVSIRQWLQTTARVFQEGLKHGAYPFSRLVGELGISMVDPNEPTFPVSFTYQNIFAALPENGEIIWGVKPSFDIYQETADHLMLEVYDWGDRLEVMLKFQKDRFNNDQITRFLVHFQHILQFFAEKPEQSLGRINALPAPEEGWLLQHAQAAGLQRHQTTQPNDFTSTFIAQAQTTPNATAVWCNGQTLSYRQLEQQSRAMAQQLRRNGVALGEPVGILMERSAEQLVAILAVLRAGAVWLGLDPDHPPARHTQILEDTGTRLVLIDDRSHPAIALDHLRFQPFSAFSQCATSEPLPTIIGTAPAYIIATSGSSGRPKNVIVHHLALHNLCAAMAATYSMNEKDRICWFASPAFDMSVEELFPALACGAAVVVRRREDLSAPCFLRLVLHSGVTLLNLPPQFFSVLQQLDPPNRTALFQQVRLVSFGGEALPETTLKAMQTYPCRIFNAYGPTEATVNASIAELTEAAQVTIGRPIQGCRLYILDETLRLTPRGCIGELYIGGTGVATGYLNQPRLTAERFRPNPFQPGRLYRSGDLVRWNESGRLEFIGRADDQCTVRGHRVEPGDIERTMESFAGIESAAVLLIGKGPQANLCAFYASAKPVDNLRRFLQQKLPAYMIPATLVHVETMPVNTNGKIDRRRLAALANTPSAPQRPLILPRNALESRLWEAWRRILGRDDFGIHESFGELGGHSLLAIQLVGLFMGEGPDRLQVRDLLGAPTIAQLAALLSKRRNETNADLPAHLVPLRRGSGHDCHIIIPGMPGLADGYHELADALPADDSVYGLQMRGLMDETPLERIEDMAAFNWQLIDQLAPQGAVHLYTHSYGGIVVYEMLRQRPWFQKQLGYILFIESRILTAMNQLTPDTIHLFCDAVVNFLQLDRTAFYRRVNELFALPETQRRAALIAVLADSETPVDKTFFLKLLNLIDKAISVDYQIAAPLPHPITLVEARCEQGDAASGLIAWDHVFPNSRRVQGDGDHITILQQPYLQSWLPDLLSRKSEAAFLEVHP